MNGWAWLGILMFVSTIILYRAWWNDMLRGKDYRDVEHRNAALKAMEKWTAPPQEEEKVEHPDPDKFWRDLS